MSFILKEQEEFMNLLNEKLLWFNLEKLGLNVLNDIEMNWNFVDI